MKYLTGCASDAVHRIAAGTPHLGLMLQPGSYLEHRVGPDYPAGHAYDNGAYGAWRTGRPFPVDAWRRGLARCPPGAMFVTVPDAVGDHTGTAALWDQYATEVIDAGHRPAFALQNGCTELGQVPAAAAAVLIGGDDTYKLSATTARLTWAARRAGLHVHMGRVNSRARFTRALAMGCDSVDGTFLRFGPPDAMLTQVRQWLTAANTHGAQLDLLDHTT